MDGKVYLLHFSRPVRGIQHEAGFTRRDPRIRLGEHLQGRGSRLTKLALAEGADICLCWAIDGDLEDEYLLQHFQGIADLCPFCQEVHRGIR